MLFGVANIDRASLINHVTLLAKVAKEFNVPSVLTAVETESFSGYIWPQLLDYGAPLDIRKAVRACVPVAHQHSAECHQSGCTHGLQQLFFTSESARNRYVDFFGLGCNCFAF